ncbi:hypothetical protein N9L68_05005 [bacterium]|nr:hypothetical protein [bacterium]
MSFFGRVVEEAIASKLSGGYVIPLFSAVGKLASGQPLLFLDGSRCCNVFRSDASPPWLMSLQPPQKTEQQTKIRKQGKHQQVDTVPTDSIVWVPFNVKITFNDQELQYEYERPVLVDGPSDEKADPCTRQRCEWDDNPYQFIKGKAKNANEGPLPFFSAEPRLGVPRQSYIHS